MKNIRQKQMKTVYKELLYNLFSDDVAGEVRKNIRICYRQPSHMIAFMLFYTRYEKDYRLNRLNGINGEIIRKKINGIDLTVSTRIKNTLVGNIDDKNMENEK